MKNVLVISASPRKHGNSDTLCDVFVQGAVEAGNTVEKVFLKEKKIGFCAACDYCVSHGGQCVQKDDMAEILQKMIQADVVVLATPVYFYSMDAQLKTLIDRTVARYTEISGKEFYYIITMADADRSAMNATIAGLRGFLECLPGAKEKGIVYGTGVWKIGEIEGKSVVNEARDMGRSV